MLEPGTSGSVPGRSLGKRFFAILPCELHADPLPKERAASHNTRFPLQPRRRFMTSSAAKIHVVFAILVVSLAACGPTKPPTDVLGVATSNLAAAQAAGAATYAPLELRSAQDHLA